MLKVYFSLKYCPYIALWVELDLLTTLGHFRCLRSKLQINSHLNSHSIIPNQYKLNTFQYTIFIHCVFNVMFIYFRWSSETGENAIHVRLLCINPLKLDNCFKKIAIHCPYFEVYHSVADALLHLRCILKSLSVFQLLLFPQFFYLSIFLKCKPKVMCYDVFFSLFKTSAHLWKTTSYFLKIKAKGKTSKKCIVQFCPCYFFLNLHNIYWNIAIS